MKTPELTLDYLASQGLSETFPQRFWAKVKKTEGCWLWTGAHRTSGYGLIGKSGVGSGNIGAHVASWIIHFGPVPDGKFVCHDCPGGDKPACVNPSHLWLGTPKDNSRDMSKKGHSTRGERSKSHKLTEQQVIEIKLRLSRGGISHAELSVPYGVCRATISQISRGKTWEHVNIPADQITDRQDGEAFNPESRKSRLTDTPGLSG